MLDNAFLHSNDFMFREREAVLPSVLNQMGMEQRSQMLKDSLTAQKLHMSLKDYKEANKIHEEARKNYADELPKRMRDSLEKQAPVQYIDDVVPDYMLDFIDKPNFGLPDAIQNADTGIYGDMRQQVLEAIEAGMTGHGYAKSRGVPLMLSDEAVASLYAMNFRSFAEDAMKVEMPKSPKAESLDDVATRRWYLESEAKIPDIIDKTKPLEQQARQAFDFRNKFRTQARDAMLNRTGAENLFGTKLNMTWEQLVDKYSKRGFSGDTLYEEIIKASTRSNPLVNESLGVFPEGEKER